MLRNCSAPNFRETGFKYFCSLFTGTKDEFATEICNSIRNGAIYAQKKSILLEKADLRFFLSYGLRTTIQITIFSTFYATDNFSSCYR